MRRFDTPSSKREKPTKMCSPTQNSVFVYFRMIFLSFIMYMPEGISFTLPVLRITVFPSIVYTSYFETPSPLYISSKDAVAETVLEKGDSVRTPF